MNILELRIERCFWRFAATSYSTCRGCRKRSSAEVYRIQPAARYKLRTELDQQFGCTRWGLFVLPGLGGDDGFVLQNGQYISLNFPGSIATVGGGINDEGQIVGGYLDSANAGHGFLLSNETYSAINYPGAITTVAESINNIGAIVGLYYNLNDPIEHGFLLKGGIFSTLDDPEAARTVPNQINNMGVIAGVVRRYKLGDTRLHAGQRNLYFD